MRRWCCRWRPATITSSPWKTTPSWGAPVSAVNELLMRNKQCKPVLNLGLPDRFVEQGSQQEIYALLGLDDAGIQRSIESWLQA